MNQHKPFFSIVLATYNRAYCIDKAIKSVLKQNFKNWELIIVDDGSTDNTDEVVSKFLNDKRIKYIKLEKNSGVNVARNNGYKIALGEWIFDLDSDNELTNDGLNKRFEVINKIKFPIIKFCVESNNVILNSKFEDGFYDYKSVLCGKISGEFTTVIKLELMKKYYWLEDINGGEAITWNLIIKELGKCYFSNEKVLKYNMENDDRLSIREKNMDRIYKIYKKQISIFGLEYLKYCPKMFFSIFFRIIYYWIKK